jgi:pilus assembly protein CpaF
MNLHPYAAENLGPLAPLLADDTVMEIMVDRPDRIYVERQGRLEDVDGHFDDAAHLLQVIRALLAPMGRTIDEAHPLLDARLPSGARMNVVLQPIAVDGPTLVIRKFRQRELSLDDLIGFGSLTPQIAVFLRACVLGRKNILISGGTGSGKTTIMNMLAGLIPDDERIITVEIATELILPQKRVVRLESRPPDAEGRGEVTMRELVLNALRMRPERLIVSELRGGEIWPLLQAMNSGHDGSMANIHANSPHDALTRIEYMATSADPSVPLLNVRQQLVSAFDLIVQQTRLSDGSRKLTTITEVLRLEREMIVLHDIFTFVETGRDEQGRILGRFSGTGYMPSFLTKLREVGLDVPSELFMPTG